MTHFKHLITLVFLSLFLTGCSLPFISTKKAALQVTSTPKSTVFLDGKHVGQTPFFDENLKAGEYSLKLVPEDSLIPLPSWETKIKLSPQILSVINRDIQATDSQSSGEILTLQSLSSKTKTTLTIISLPDNAVIKIDDQPKGFTPTSVDDISAGEHTITLSSPGYTTKTIRAKITAGHKLTISAQLAQEPIISDDQVTPNPALDDSPSSPKPSSSPGPSSSPDKIASASAQAKSTPYVKVLDNSVGFLRIRDDASVSSVEIARAVPGQKLPYLEEEENGWYKISYSPGKSGWVSRGSAGEYAELVE